MSSRQSSVEPDNQGFLSDSLEKQPRAVSIRAAIRSCGDAGAMTVCGRTPHAPRAGRPPVTSAGLAKLQEIDVSPGVCKTPSECSKSGLHNLKPGSLRSRRVALRSANRQRAPSTHSVHPLPRASRGVSMPRLCAGADGGAHYASLLRSSRQPARSAPRGAWNGALGPGAHLPGAISKTP